MPVWLPAVVWLCLLIVFALVEAATVGLVSVWFAVGALAALIATFFTANIWVQIGIFLVVSAVALAVIRPLTKRYFTPKKEATNADRAIGKEAVVTETIDNLKGQGAVSLAGQTWTARSETPEHVLPEGSTVTVLRIEGVKLIVRGANTEKE